MLDIGEANNDSPARVVIYAEGGMGKSTFGAMSDSPIFIAIEKGVDRLKDKHGKPIKFIKDVDTFQKIRSAVRSLITENHNFKTLVIDSADWAEAFAHKEIIGTSNKTIITVNGGYNAGFRQSENMHQALIADIEELREKKKMHIIVIAHATTKEVKDPSVEKHDGFKPKMNDMISSLWKEWCDAQIFVRHEVFTKTDDKGKVRAFSSGKRIALTEQSATHQAKNRYGLPEEMEFTKDFWNELMKYAGNGVSTEQALKELEDKMANPKLAPYLERIKSAIEKANGDVTQLLKIGNYATTLLTAGE